jgi:hypothetical protein
MSHYRPELGQMFFGNPAGEFEMPEYACSLLVGVLDEFGRVFWNQHQKSWDRDEAVTMGGVTFRPYWWGDDNAPEAALPNLQLEGDLVEIRWYKHSKRGQSCNHVLTPGQWAAWHDRVMRALKLSDYERDSLGRTHPDEAYDWYAEPSPAVDAVDPQVRTSSD